MPRKSNPRRQPRKTYRPRRYGRRAKYSKNGGKITALKTATVPDRLVLRMKYVDNFQLIGAGGATRIFRANSIYDPDTSLVNGHQPLGYDQWDIFYQKYRVFKANVVMKITNVSANAADAEQVGMCAITANTPLTSDDAFFEQPHCKKVQVAGRGGIDTKMITYSVDIPRMLGMAPVVYKSSPNTSALFGFNPAEVVNLAIFARPLDGASSTLLSCEIAITYFVELFDRAAVKLSWPAGKNPDAPSSGDGGFPSPSLLNVQ